MAPQRLNGHGVSTEAEQVFELIDNGQNFLLSGGAGSGKTYSLVEVINLVLQKKTLSNVACITYTNAAVREIEERVNHPNLHVSTIHEFLWHCIKRYQKELKAIIVELINDDDQTKFKQVDGVVESDCFNHLEKGIQYKEYVKIKNGIISHDELLIVANKMFEKHRKLCSITKDSFPYIFIDEYQDTDSSVVNILLDHFNQSDKKCVIGFFGDAMQSIYEGSIGNLDEYKGEEEGLLKEVKKEQNRRNPKRVINLANLIRHDGLVQHPSDDISAPNMNSDGTVKEGEILFLYSSSDDLNIVRDRLEWDFNNSKKTKELNLTHNLIARKAGFEGLMKIYDGDKILDFVYRIKKFIKNKSITISVEGRTFGDVITELQEGKTSKDLKAVLPTPGMQEYIAENQDIYNLAFEFPYEEISSMYVDKDQLLDDKKNDLDDAGKAGSQRDDLIRHLFKIQDNIRLYKEGKISEFLRHTDFKILSVAAKTKLKENIESLVEVGDSSIEEIITLANEYGVSIIDDRLLRFKEKRKYIYNQVSELPFSQFQKLYQYLEGYTPFSTQHKTKGAEFPNVLVILDNGNWNNYNFENLFTGAGRDTVLHRTQKIFYVCCTRAKEKLAVFYHNPPQSVLEKASEWFGRDNIINLDA